MLSVIVVTYEQPVTLRALLMSLSAQTYPGEFEVLVCDDGSNSDLRAVVSGFPFEVRYIRQPHLGFRAGSARNKGIRDARGDILVFLDGDILVSPTFLAAHAAQHDGSRTLVCGTRRSWLVSPQSCITLESVLASGEPLDSTESAKQRAHIQDGTRWMAMLSSNFSVPRRPEAAFDEGFRGWGSEDRELAFRLVRRHGYEVRLVLDAEAVHVCWRGAVAVNDPFVTHDHDQLVDFIANKLHLAALHRDDPELLPALWLLTLCALDPATGRWSVSPTPVYANAWEALETARAWFRKNHRPRPQTSGPGLPNYDSLRRL